MRKIIKVGKYLYFFFNYYNHLYHKQKRKMYFLFLFWDFLNIKENYISNFFLVANHIIGVSWAKPVCLGEVLEGSKPWEGGRWPSLTLSKGKHHGETVRGRGKGPTLFEARFVDDSHELPNIAQDHGKLLKHAWRLKIFTTTSIWEPLPNLCRIKYVWDSLNRENISLKDRAQG